MDEVYLTRARDLERVRPFRFVVRSRLRGAAVRVLRTIPREPDAGVRIVHYHYVFDDELSNFASHLELFRRDYEPVTLSEAVARLREGRVQGRELAVTFDDGFRNQLANAEPLLREAGFRACFFLVTDLLGADGRSAATFCRERLHLPRPVEPLTWEEAAELLELGHEVGSHTRRHLNLATASESELEREVAGSREELERRLGRAVAHFSAPYGERHRFAPAVAEAARRAGYVSCATAQRGLNGSADDVYALRRDHLSASWPAADVRYFLARA